MPSITGDPRVKLLMSYDIVAQSQQAYYEFILREFLDAFGELTVIPILENPKGELQELLPSHRELLDSARETIRDRRERRGVE